VAVHKRRLQKRGGGLSSSDTLQRKGFFRYGRLHFLKQKTSDFLKIMVCRTNKGEEEV